MSLKNDMVIGLREQATAAHDTTTEVERITQGVALNSVAIGAMAECASGPRRHAQRWEAESARCLTEKLKRIEALRDSLMVDTSEHSESPAWHGQALKHGEEQLAAGSTHFDDWATAKAYLRGGGGA